MSRLAGWSIAVAAGLGASDVEDSKRHGAMRAGVLHQWEVAGRGVARSAHNPDACILIGSSGLRLDGFASHLQSGLGPTLMWS